MSHKEEKTKQRKMLSYEEGKKRNFEREIHGKF